MSYLRCPNCKLTFRIRPAGLPIERCPRCIARSRRISLLQPVDRKRVEEDTAVRSLPAPERDAGGAGVGAGTGRSVGIAHAAGAAIRLRAGG